MTSEVANVFDVHLQDDIGEDLCVVCQETLNMHPRYTLPECHHTFHIHCIIAWFRCQSVNDDGVVGGRCPCCGDRGVNSRHRPCRRWRRRWGGDPEMTSHLALLRKESRKPNAPHALVSLVEKERKAAEEIVAASGARREYEEYLKTNMVEYKIARSKCHSLRKSYYSRCRRHRGIQSALYNFPIIPIIIPTPVDVNWPMVSQMV